MSTTHPRSAPPGTLTYEEFLDWADEDTLAEIIGKAYTDDRRRRWQRRGL